MEEVLGTIFHGNFEPMTNLRENWCWNPWWHFYQKYQEFWQSIDELPEKYNSSAVAINFLNNISLWQIKLVVNLLEFCNDKGWGCSLRKVWLRRQGSYRFFSLNNIRPEKCISKRMQRIRPTRKLDVWNNFKFTFYLYLVPPVLLAL